MVETWRGIRSTRSKTHKLRGVSRGKKTRGTALHNEGSMATIVVWRIRLGAARKPVCSEQEDRTELE